MPWRGRNAFRPARRGGTGGDIRRHNRGSVGGGGGRAEIVQLSRRFMGPEEPRADGARRTELEKAVKREIAMRLSS
jgi:hypothetical protein